MKEASPPVSAMATPTNGSGNLVDEFEEAFQHCLNVLTKEEAVPNSDKDEMKVEVEQTTLRFIDLARQMEAFFLQKRFLLSALKPEMIVKEDINEYRLELARKDELLKRHYEKIAVWQNLLADLQGYAKSPAQGSATPTLNNGGSVQSPMAGLPGNQTPNPMMVSGMSTTMQQQLQQQQLQQMQQQQQMQQMQQQQIQQLQQQMQVPPGMAGGVGPGMVSPQQAMFMQQQAMGGPRGPFSQQGPGGVLQGPLAYLEKTTSNIGMTDGRR
ncbi:mediator of RNA polymerase II transcription subunit 28 isoform X1 [Tribolium castaneum]|uniref:mediator of RNA polymerase II transcription subunit 28 isoform X1 n=1 Tax=Tribolium castaneum TaxID=7070 RepID=UPI00046C01F9|nr:PREDICTED: mediator of RNA polymerase II transcription subunit 28 isoform X1 [Tribolium castaneum]|eukprot:XP_008201628.1 PREDICTED: mediator of RNA polymerase II transcription subunit 28 isoform X1 [Tribolium castaneum]